MPVAPPKPGMTHSHQVFLAAKRLVELVELTPNLHSRPSVAAWVIGFVSRKFQQPVLAVEGDALQQVVNAFLVAEAALAKDPSSRAREPQLVATVAEGAIRLLERVSDEGDDHNAR